MSGSWILSGILLLPVVGALFILLLPGETEATKRNARWIALFATLLTFVLSLVAWGRFNPAEPGFQLIEEHDWFSHVILYKLGVDGISMPFVLLTTLLMPISIAASWTIENRVKEYMIAFLVLEMLMIGVFVALDLILFYVFFEGSLIPMFLIIGIWGHKNRVYAAFKFFLYTLYRLGSDAARDHGDVLDRGHHRHHRSAQDRIRAEDADLVVARFLRFVRGQAADVAGAHLAAGRPCRSADGGLGDPGRPFS